MDTAARQIFLQGQDHLPAGRFGLGIKEILERKLHQGQRTWLTAHVRNHLRHQIGLHLYADFQRRQGNRPRQFLRRHRTDQFKLPADQLA